MLDKSDCHWNKQWTATQFPVDNFTCRSVMKMKKKKKSVKTSSFYMLIFLITSKLSCIWQCWNNFFIIIIIIIIIYSLTARVVGAPQMISQPVSSILPCSPLPSGTWRTPGLVFQALPLSALSSFPFYCALQDGFGQTWRTGDHTTAVCVSLQWSGGLRVVRLPARSWHGLPLGNMVFVWNA